MIYLTLKILAGLVLVLFLIVMAAGCLWLLACSKNAEEYNEEHDLP